MDIRYNFTRYRKKSPLNTKGGAQEYETYLRTELAKHGSLEHLAKTAEPKAAPVTFGEFAERWMREYVAAERMKRSGQRSKRGILARHLVPALGHLAVTDITADRVARLKGDLSARRTRHGDHHLSPKTINNVLTVLRKSLDCATEWGIIKSPPRIRSVRLGPSSYRFLTAAEITSLLGATPPGPWKTTVTVALFTGLRFNELAALEWSDVDVARRQLRVWRGKVEGHLDSPKGNRSRIVPFPPTVADALSFCEASSGPVFPHLTTHKQAWGTLRRISADAGLAPVGWHDLRHTYATNLVADGVPLPTVQRMLGHSDIRTTMRYVHVGSQDHELRAAADSLQRRILGNRWATEPRSRSSGDAHADSTVAQESQTTALEAVV